VGLLDIINLVLAIFAFLVVSVYILSGVDDLLYDLHFWVHYARRLWAARRFPRITIEWLEAREQQKVAILIPAWHETAVIGRMLRTACETIRYRNYDIFVGTYPNDQETQRQVDLVTQEHPRVHKVISPTPGPTTKAHNLNNMQRAIVAHARTTGQHYEIFITHDAEDVIHPLALLMSNYLIPRKDMIQLPVFPAPAPLRQITYWTYADEFAENHTKDLLVREMTGGFVPSAGVGTAYTRRAFELIALVGQGDVFSTRSLTEDYEFGLRLRLEGLRTAFVIQRTPLALTQNGSRPYAPWTWIATQALFPRDLQAAVRQKTRWTLGIALQSWAVTGWPGGIVIRYNLFHDRKVLVTNLLSFLGYGLVGYLVAYEAYRTSVAPDLLPLIPSDSTLWHLLPVAAALMAWRLVQRFIAVRRVYGVWPALTAMPRTVWANWINFAATVRALALFFLVHRGGREIAWDKTEHEFPLDLGNGVLLAALGGVNGYPGNGIPLDPIVIEDEVLAAALETDLRSPDVGTRLGAIRRVPAELGSRLLEPLLERLQDASWPVRAEACRTLGFLRLPHAAPDLERAAGDAVWTVRANAVHALAKLGDAGEAALLNLLRGADTFAREAALARLEQQGFVARNVRRLQSANPAEVERGKQFFQHLERHGPSRLASETLKRTFPADVVGDRLRGSPRAPQESSPRPARGRQDQAHQTSGSSAAGQRRHASAQGTRQFPPEGAPRQRES
jgi:adsorption protein B